MSFSGAVFESGYAHLLDEIVGSLRCVVSIEVGKSCGFYSWNITMDVWMSIVSQ